MHKLKSLTQTCGACPSQWVGELVDGTPVYVRYRWGYLTVTLNPWADGAEEIYCEGIGNGLDGFITEEDMLKAVAGVLDSAEYESKSETA